MKVCIVNPTDCCDVFSKISSCSNCSYAIKQEDGKILCPTLVDIGDCDGCPFTRGSEYEEFCNCGSLNGSKPCENDKYRNLPISDLIIALDSENIALYEHLRLEDESVARKEATKSEGESRARKTRMANYRISSEITSARQQLRRYINSESRLRGLHSTFSVVGNILDSSKSSEFKSPYSSQIAELESKIATLTEERARNSKKIHSEMRLKEVSNLDLSINSYIQEIQERGIPKCSSASIIIYTGERLGMSCKLDAKTYQAIARMDSKKVLKKNITGQYTKVDFTFNGCDEVLLQKLQYMQKQGRIFTTDLVEFNGELLSQYEFKYKVKNLEVTSARVKNIILKAIVT